MPISLLLYQWRRHALYLIIQVVQWEVVVGMSREVGIPPRPPLSLAFVAVGNGFFCGITLCLYVDSRGGPQLLYGVHGFYFWWLLVQNLVICFMVESPLLFRHWYEVSLLVYLIDTTSCFPISSMCNFSELCACFDRKIYDLLRFTEPLTFHEYCLSLIEHCWDSDSIRL